MSGQRGLTFIEVLVVLAILALALGVTAMQLQPVASPVDTATNLVEGEFREARLNAIATMSAYRVSPATPSQLKGEKAASCSATTWTLDSSMNNPLPTGVTMSPSSWSVCFSSRGISTNSLTVTVSHPTYGSKGVMVLYGGTTRVTP
jgi:prepilin-type N-terminal cleavage/methylation domain-containing protein